MKQQCIEIKNLKGYRSPTQLEKQQIYCYMESELLKTKKQLKLFRIVLGCIAFLLTWGVISEFVNGMTDLRNFGIEAVITIVLWIIFAIFQKSIMMNQKFTLHIKNGEYEVLECLSYEHHYAQEGGRKEGSVKIQTRDGTLCAGNFVVDIETALLSEKGTSLPLLLLYEKDTGIGRVFSEKMLNRG